jgi:hypothetical protein
MTFLYIYLIGVVIMFIVTALLQRWSDKKSHCTFVDDYLSGGIPLFIMAWPIMISLAIIACVVSFGSLPFVAIWSKIAGDK